MWSVMSSKSFDRSAECIHYFPGVTLAGVFKLPSDCGTEGDEEHPRDAMCEWAKENFGAGSRVTISTTFDICKYEYERL